MTKSLPHTSAYYVDETKSSLINHRTANLRAEVYKEV
jgi:hypothetical protein